MERIKRIKELIAEYLGMSHQGRTIDAFDVAKDLSEAIPDITDTQIIAFIRQLRDEGCQVSNCEAFEEADPGDSDNRGSHLKMRKRRSAEISGSSPLNMLIREAENHPLLTQREELELGAALERGEVWAREKMILANIRLVIDNAKRYVGQGLDIEDLVQEGFLGLTKAIDRFDVRHGYRFSTYATWWIRQYLTRAVQNHGRMIRLPVHVHETLGKLRKAVSAFQREHGSTPSDKDLAEALGISESRVREYLAYMEIYDRNLASLEAPIGDDEDTELLAVIPDDDYDLETEVLDKFLGDEIRNQLHTLSDREQQVIRLRFGLDDGVPKTLETVGQLFGVTRERIRQIEAKALKKMRHPKRSRYLREYL